MKVTKADIVISAVKPQQYPSGQLPEIALAGRSNVGKSSLINKLINRKNLARTSQKPGKTQTLNFYLINEELYFVDVPGYGYAKVSKKERAKWGEMIETYLTSRQQLMAVILIIDVRHAPSEDDVNMYHWLKHFELPVIIAATKADKIKKSQYHKQLKVISEALGLAGEDRMILFSSATGDGKTQLWKTIESYL